MSWLAKELNLSYDWFAKLMEAREEQTAWLADLMCEHDLPKAIIGYSFKPETNVTVGSPALLLRNILRSREQEVLCYDPYVDDEEVDVEKLGPHVFLIGTKHPCFENMVFPEGSVVIDPWRLSRRTSRAYRSSG